MPLRGFASVSCLAARSERILAECNEAAADVAALVEEFADAFLADAECSRNVAWFFAKQEKALPDLNRVTKA